MDSQELFVYENIIHDMQEGVLVIGMNGGIKTVNPAGLIMLNLTSENIGSPFGIAFLADERNDDFVQVVLNSVYDQGVSHNAVVDFFDGHQLKKLFINTSYMKKGNERIGVIAVLNDVTELMDLRDAITAMNRIEKLNKQLEIRNEFIQKTFGRYLSDSLVEQILEEGQIQIGGVKKEVTIMFTDLRGFTAISETMQPDMLLAMLNHYLECMIDIIVKWDGTILEFIGDAIVVVFGAPIQKETAVTDSICCAVQMQQAMEEVNQYNESKMYPQLQMGIGIHTGEVIVGNIGSQQKTKYDIIGRNVNLASRIETYTVGGQVLISEETRKRSDIPMEFHGQMEISPKGVKEALTVYDVQSAGGYDLLKAENCFTILDPPWEAEVCKVEGKALNQHPIPVTILKISGCQAIFQSEHTFALYSDIQLQYKEKEVFAKVVEQEELLTTIHYTSGMI